jgi:hypothetical protein
MEDNDDIILIIEATAVSKGSNMGTILTIDPTTSNAAIKVVSLDASGNVASTPDAGPFTFASSDAAVIAISDNGDGTATGVSGADGTATVSVSSVSSGLSASADIVVATGGGGGGGGGGGATVSLSIEAVSTAKA